MSAQHHGRQAVEEWNTHCPPGTRVRYWPVLPPIPSSPPVDTTTRSEAWCLGDGSPVVLIAGRTGGIHIGHLEVLP